MSSINGSHSNLPKVSFKVQPQEATAKENVKENINKKNADVAKQASSASSGHISRETAQVLAAYTGINVSKPGKDPVKQEGIQSSALSKLHKAKKHADIDKAIATESLNPEVHAGLLESEFAPVSSVSYELGDKGAAVEKVHAKRIAGSPDISSVHSSTVDGLLSGNFLNDPILA